MMMRVDHTALAIDKTWFEIACTDDPSAKSSSQGRMPDRAAVLGSNAGSAAVDIADGLGDGRQGCRLI